jgi:hypothetical protein
MKRNLTLLPLLALLSILGGCAAHCTEPELRAARHGVVLECRSISRNKTSCTVSTGDGDRTFIYRSICE